MLKPAKNKLAFYVIVSLIILSVFSAILSLKSEAYNPFKWPLALFNLIKREAGAIIFYHRNFTQNERLVKESGLLRQKINSLNEIFLENQRLRKLLSFRQNTPFKVIPARVIARAPDSWSSAVIIDKGTHYGIRKGMAAIDYLGLVGRVVESADSSAKVMLISDPNLGVSGIVQRSRQEGLVSGTLGSYLIMRYLPEEADIKVHDTIITSGLSEAFPKGLLIGSVVDISREFSGLSRYAIIRPAANLSCVEEILVIVQ